MVTSSAVETPTSGDKSRDGLCLIMGRVVHVLSQVKDASHYLVRGEEVIGVERVDDTMFCVTKVASGGDAAEHEKSQVLRMDDFRAIDHFARLVVVVKVLTHEVIVLCKRQSRALAEHVVVHQ
jgi:hypothetical protein